MSFGVRVDPALVSNVLRGGARPPVAVMVDFIDRHKDVDGIESVCRVLQVAPSTYYAAKPRAPSVRTVRDAVLAPQLHRLGSDNFGVYGA